MALHRETRIASSSVSYDSSVISIARSVALAWGYISPGAWLRQWEGKSGLKAGVFQGKAQASISNFSYPGNPPPFPQRPGYTTIAQEARIGTSPLLCDML